MANKNSILEPLIKENERLRQENKQLQDSVETLNKRINTLEEKLAALKKNSRNSSKPPSSDIVKTKKSKAKEGKRKQGAQPGHPKHERLLFNSEQINKFYDHILPSCPDCHGQVTLRPDRCKILVDISLITAITPARCKASTFLIKVPVHNFMSRFGGFHQPSGFR